MLIEILASRLPSPYKGRDEAGASGLSSAVKDEGKGWAGRRYERINLIIVTCLLKETYQSPVVIKKRSLWLVH